MIRGRLQSVVPGLRSRQFGGSQHSPAYGVHTYIHYYGVDVPLERFVIRMNASWPWN